MLTARFSKVRLSVVAAAGILVIAALNGFPATSTPAEATVAPEPTPVAAVSSEIAREFAIFRERPAATIPAELAASLASPARFGRNAQLAREIATERGQGWIVPGDGYLCIIAPDSSGGYGTSCNTIEGARQRGVVLSFRDGVGGAGHTAALLPDGHEATLTTGSRALRSESGVVSALLSKDQDLKVAPAS